MKRAVIGVAGFVVLLLGAACLIYFVFGPASFVSFGRFMAEKIKA
jgi:hypothetical protein